MGKFNLNEFDMGKKKAKAVKPVEAEQVAEKVVTQTSAKKVPMMNIRFSPENYEYMRREAAMRGLSVIKFTNWIIDQYRSDPAHVHNNDLYMNEENW